MGYAGLPCSISLGVPNCSLVSIYRHRWKKTMWTKITWKLNTIHATACTNHYTFCYNLIRTSGQLEKVLQMFLDVLGCLNVFNYNMYMFFFVFRCVPSCSELFRGIPGCSRVFRGVPGCSWMFRDVPAFSGVFRGCSVVFLVVLGCSGMFRGVPWCTGVFRVVSRCSGLPVFLVFRVVVHA